MDFARQTRVAILGTGLVFAVVLIASLLVQDPRWHPIVSGLALGLAGSLWIVWSMKRQTESIVPVAGGRPRQSTVFFLASRWAAAAAVALFAIKWKLNAPAAALGLLVGLVIVVADGFMRYLRNRR